MNLLKSYSHQVVAYLPEKSRDDLFAEIYDSLCEEFAEWQTRHPGRDEVDFLDERKEHPLRYASRLAAEGTPYLIGPQFYFSFISALKVGASIATAFYLLLGVVLALTSGEYLASFWNAIKLIPGALLWVCAAILGVFIALEKSGERARWLDRWSARDLRPIKSHRPISKGEIYFDLALSILILLWVLDLIQWPSAVRQDGSWLSELVFALPVVFWYALGALLLFDVGFRLMCLAGSFWSPGLRLTAIAGNVLWIALLAYAAVQSPLVTVTDATTTVAADLLALANHSVRGVLWSICLVLAGSALYHLWRLVGKGRSGSDDLLAPG